MHLINSVTGTDFLIGIPIFLFVSVHLSCRFWKDPIARATARSFRYLGKPIGCDYRDPKAHLKFYTDGLVHLCNESCIHEPPEER
jgi:hypothetical protein